jgi:uncharacterized membrane protein
MAAAVSVISLLFSKIIEKRVAAVAKGWGVNEGRAIAISNWAADAGQAMAASFALLLALIVLVSAETPDWLTALYVISALLALSFGLFAVGFARPAEWATKFWWDLPPAATVCFIANAVACILVVVYY